MKFRLVETLEQPFRETVDLYYDADELAQDYDPGKASGDVVIELGPSEIMEVLWDFMVDDKHNPPLTNDEFERLSEDDDAYEQYVKDNFDMLFKKYEKEFYDKFRERAKDKLYDNWDSYSDVAPFSGREEDEREFWRNVWGH